MLMRTVERRFPFNDENRMLRGILAKLDPQPAAKPAPPPPVSRAGKPEARKAKSLSDANHAGLPADKSERPVRSLPHDARRQSHGRNEECRSRPTGVAKH